LKSWALVIDVISAPTAAEDTEAVQIPDLEPNGIVRTLTLPGGLMIQDMTVAVDITHPQIGDLRISLLSPEGIPITLHDQVGGGTDNLAHTWRIQDHVGLRSLRGKQAGGTWQLRVVDLSGQNVGKLNRWKIEVM
jgi:subtilisin-like proprotein convertase family protein